MYQMTTVVHFGLEKEAAVWPLVATCLAPKNLLFVGLGDHRGGVSDVVLLFCFLWC